MPNKIQFKRGLKASLPDLDAGEPGYCTDTQELFIGNSVGANKKVVMSGEVFYNVKDYGAKGNNANDDTTSIQAAIDAAQSAGGIVILPPGTYLSGSLNLYRNIQIMGAGVDVTTVKAKPNINASVIIASAIDNVTITNLTVDGNGANQTSGSTITFYKSRFNKLTNIKVVNNYEIGLNMSNVEETIIEGCTVDGTKINTAISFSNDDPAYINGNNIITNNIMKNAFLDGIIYNTNNGVITENKIINNGINPSITAGGIYSNGRTGLLISDNIIESNDGNGIDLINCSDAEISNNRLFANNSSGIMLDTCYNSIVTGNLCKNNAKAPATDQDDGITLLGACSNITIIGNRCFDNQTTKTQKWGVHISAGSDGTTVNGNNCIGNFNAAGIQNDSTATSNRVVNNQPDAGNVNAISLAASASINIIVDNTKYSILTIFDKSSSVVATLFIRGTNNVVTEISDVFSSFESTDSGTTTAVFHNGTAYVIKNRKAATSFYSYRVDPVT